jgi:hypothetical protein
MNCTETGFRLDQAGPDDSGPGRSPMGRGRVSAAGRGR